MQPDALNKQDFIISTANPNLIGTGILSGLQAYQKDPSRIVITPGVAITSDGYVIQLTEEKVFKYYYLDFEKKQDIINYYEGFINPDSKYKIKDIYFLTHLFKVGETDPLLSQYKSDSPDDFFLDDKVLSLLFDSKGHFYFVLLTLSDVVHTQQLEKDLKQIVKQQQPTPRPGLFPKDQVIQQTWEAEDIEQLLNKSLQLPQVFIRRFGYHHLSLKHLKRNLDFDQPDTPERLDNLQNPFSKIDSFSDIFFEYKAIIDESISELRSAIETLHRLYGHLLDPTKSVDYLNRYTELLEEKWKFFLDRGEYLFYVQFFYDWLIDITKAYNELIICLNKKIVTTTNLKKENDFTFRHVWLGLVSVNPSHFAKRVFRDYFEAPTATAGQEENLYQFRFLHWRLLMMIRTFDLPFLRLDSKVLKKFFTPSVEDRDSSDYWERLNVVNTAATSEKEDIVDFEDLPLKATPTNAGWQPLHIQCIPYYYPLSHSYFSVHRYWDYEKYLLGKMNENTSYNAFRGLKFGAAEKTSYTELPAIVYPLAFNLQAFAGFKIEGVVGRRINLFVSSNKDKDGKIFSTPPDEKFMEILKDTATLYLTHLLNEIRNTFNLRIDILLVDVSYKVINKEKVETQPTLGKLIGLEHKNWIAQGETLVLVYTLGKLVNENGKNKYSGEQIELDECTADETPEIPPYTIVADFTLPYLYSCCKDVVQTPGITVIPYNSTKLKE